MDPIMKQPVFHGKYGRVIFAAHTGIKDVTHPEWFLQQCYQAPGSFFWRHMIPLTSINDKRAPGSLGYVWGWKTT